MKRLVVDAMIGAALQEEAARISYAASVIPRDMWRELARMVNHRHQCDKFRAYILAHMTETPWLPVMGADDD